MVHLYILLLLLSPPNIFFIDANVGLGRFHYKLLRLNSRTRVSPTRPFYRGL